MSSVLRDIRSEWKDHLEAIAFFEDIPIITEDDGHLSESIDKALGALKGASSKAGICVVLETPAAICRNDDNHAIVFDEVRMNARVIEIPEINRKASIGTLHTAHEVAEAVLAYTHIVFKPTSANQPMCVGSPALQPDREELPLQVIDCAFFTSASLLTTLTQCATPALSQSLAGAVTITCATTGAAVWYTTNGKNPTPATGTLYAAPFSPGAVTVKARAWLAGKLASEVGSLTVVLP